MELRTYWAVVWRWRWLALAVAVITFAASLTIQTREPTLYTATMRLAMRPNIDLGDPAALDGPAREQYYEYTTAEFLNDDIMDVVQSPTFHQTVGARAAAKMGRPVNAAIDAKKAHKLMKFDVTADSPEDAQVVAQSIADLLADPKAGYFRMFVSFDPTVTIVDQIVVSQATAPSRVYLYMLLRVLLALVAGLGLAFLLEYLDDTVRSAREVESVTGLPVLAEIPAGRSRSGSSRTAPTGPEGRIQTA